MARSCTAKLVVVVDRGAVTGLLGVANLRVHLLLEAQLGSFVVFGLWLADHDSPRRCVGDWGLQTGNLRSGSVTLFTLSTSHRLHSARYPDKQARKLCATCCALLSGCYLS